MIKHSSVAELSQSDQELISQATQSLALSYVPYSKFKVASVVHTVEGNTALGANQENASYPLCICGERVALFNKAIYFPDEAVDTIVIRTSGGQKKNDPAPPCGACLQVMREFEHRHNRPMRILLQADDSEIYEFSSVSELLPVSFSRDFLIEDQ